ncbi:MAG: hypothetical protein PVI21_03625 [Candidatus Woesebacteria bacterium]|jgi:tRNA G10  N-methylase Trm11
MKYIATFPAGTFPLIVKYLKGFSVVDFKILEHDESSVTFDSALNIERLIEIRFFTNVFVVIENVSRIKKLIKGEHFRLICISGGKPVSMALDNKSKFERQIEHDFKLTPNSRLSRNDFYVIKRNDGTSLFSLRLPRAKFKRDNLAPGELRPELANVLCLAAGVRAKDTIVDMFAGTGAILYEAVRGFGVKKAVAVDLNVLPDRHEMPQIVWHKTNLIGGLDFIKSGSVDRVVTDPPWGKYDSVVDLEALYKGFLLEASRILKCAGVMVVLSAFSGFDECLAAQPNLKVLGRWDVLVSGKKATIYKVQKGLG